MKAGKHEHRWGGGVSAHRIDVIEANPDLVQVLRAKEGVSVVGYDWLTYSGVSYYDAILTTGPFCSRGRW